MAEVLSVLALIMSAASLGAVAGIVQALRDGRL